MHTCIRKQRIQMHKYKVEKTWAEIYNREYRCRNCKQRIQMHKYETENIEA